MDSERSYRSVFVGNIPYDATEERLKEILSNVGVVRNFKLVYDRETGKPKGFGFCEYHDVETANSAISNLNGFELNGRPIRVDSAVNQKLEDAKNAGNAANMNAAGAGADDEWGPTRDYDDDDDFDGSDDSSTDEDLKNARSSPEEAPKMIAQTIAGMSEEQKWQTARQFQIAVNTNYAEMQRHLTKNPQLALAMVYLCKSVGLIDTEVASTMLYPPRSPEPVIPIGNQGPPPVPFDEPTRSQPFQPMPGAPPPHQFVNGPPGYPPQQPIPPPIPAHDPRVRHDPRAGLPPPPPEVYHVAAPLAPQVPLSALDPRLRGQAPIPAPVPPPSSLHMDPRSKARPPQHPLPVPPPSQLSSASSATAAAVGMLGGPDQTNTEKADLIRQIFALDDSQIAALPDEQRQSIMEIKRQLNHQSS